MDADENQSLSASICVHLRLSLLQPEAIEAASKDLRFPVGAAGAVGVGEGGFQAALHVEEVGGGVLVGGDGGAEGDAAEILDGLGQLQIGGIAHFPGGVPLGELLGAESREP